MNGAETLRVLLVTLEQVAQRVEELCEPVRGGKPEEGEGAHTQTGIGCRIPPTPPSHLLHSHAAVTFHPVFPSGVLELPGFSAHTQTADLRCEDQEEELHTLTLEFEQNELSKLGLPVSQSKNNNGKIILDYKQVSIKEKR